MNDYMMFDVTALLIFSTLIVSNISKNRIKGHTSWLYTIELIVCVVTLLFRLTYQILLRHVPYSEGSVFLVKSFVYLSLVGHCCIYPVGIWFVFSSIGIVPIVRKSMTLKILMLIISLVPLIYILMDIISNTIFIIDDHMKLVFLGPLWILNISIVILMLFGFTLACVYSRVLERIHVIYSMILFPINIGLFILQCMRPHAQVEMFVLAITAYLVFATIQRPELLIDPQTLAQSSTAFENEVKKVMNINLPAKIIFIKI